MRDWRRVPTRAKTTIEEYLRCVEVDAGLENGSDLWGTARNCGLVVEVDAGLENGSDGVIGGR